MFIEVFPSIKETNLNTCKKRQNNDVERGKQIIVKLQL